MAESLGPLTLVCWGAVFLAYFGRGDLAVFVAPFFRPLVAAAGVALAAVGFGLCVLPRRSACGHHDHDHGHGAGAGCCEEHGHSHDESLSFGLVVRTVTLFLPLALLFSVRPEGFSATTVRNRGIIRAAPPTDKPLEVEVAAPAARAPDAGPRKIGAEAIFSEPEQHRATIGAGGAEELTVYEIMVLSADPELRQKMADARVLGIKVEGAAPAGIEEMEWVQVEGTLAFEQSGPGVPQPTIRAARVEKADEPDEPFLY